MTPRRHTSAAALCLLLAIAHTWPLASAPHVLSLNHDADAMLNQWIVAWVQHQLPRAPARLFDANIFHPARGVLGYSEPLFVPAVMGAPVRALGGSPVLVYNLLLIAGLALTAFATYALVFEWTGDRTAGLLAGSAFAFNTHMLTRLPHLQAMHAYGLPLALLATDRLIVHARTRDAFLLALWMAVLAYTSGYLVIFGAVMVAVALVARIAEWRVRALAVVSRFGLASIVAAVAVAPVYLAYRRVAVEQTLWRPLEGVAQFSATPTGYLASATRLHRAAFSDAFYRDPIDAFFPGAAVVLLSLAAVVLVWRQHPDPQHRHRTRARILMLLCLAAAGFLLSLGTNTPIYGWLYRVFPPLTGIRAASRFGILFLLATAALAALGLALLRSSGLLGRRAPLAAAVLIAVVNIEALSAPFHYERFEGIPRVYDLLAQERGPVVLAEHPFYLPQLVFQNAEYVFNSTAHWRPLMNGYSGYTPTTYRAYAPVFSSFPDPAAIDAMRRAGVTHVMVHPRRYGRHGDDVLRRVDSSPDLERVATGRFQVSLYKLR